MMTATVEPDPRGGWCVLVREPGRNATAYRHTSKTRAAAHAADIEAMNQGDTDR
jgi:hypothetical protein